MVKDVKSTVIDGVRKPLDEHGVAFKNLLEMSRGIDSLMSKDTELLTEIGKKFDALSAAVELEFEGISVFDQEIKKTKGILEKSIASVNESLVVSSKISEDLDNISRFFEKIHSDGVELEESVKNISMVSDSIEVASRNAGITAFHAGKQGRGFEVISREMTLLVRSVQDPARFIPEVSGQIIKGAVSLDRDLLKISSIIQELGLINERFSNITDNLLGLIPNIESGIKTIASSVESQKALHRLLMAENKRSSDWLGQTYDMARSSAILEIYLETMFRCINNIRESLINVEDNTSFARLFQTLKIALVDAGKRYAYGMKMSTVDSEVGKMGIMSSERSILQLVTESNQLSQAISTIGDEIKNWLNTNELAIDVLAKGIAFYQDIIAILSSLNEKLHSLQSEVGNIAMPLANLKKITERSRVLGLYASIESARGGEYAKSLGVVTQEIKDLSAKSTTFVSNIDDVWNDMAKSFDELSSFLLMSVSDVEQGMSSLNSAINILDENRKVLNNLDNLAQEMIGSTEHMKIQCNELNEHVRDLNKDYQAINQGFGDYSNHITQCAKTAEQLLNKVNSYDKEFSVIEHRVKTIVFRQSVEPIILDPANKTDARSHEVIEQIFTGLLGFDSSNHLVPGIADSFSASKDGLIWDFKIKKKVKFHNGETATAQDVANAMARVKKGPNVSFIDYVDDVMVIDDLHLRFSLKFPYLPFLANLACGVCDVTPRNFSPDNPVGTGPYRFVSWEKNKELVLEAFDDFYEGRPPIDRVIIKFIKDNKEAVSRFKSGEISLMSVSLDAIKEFPDESVLSGPGLSTQYVCINVSPDTPFKNRKVRQAMNHAIDKEYFTKYIMQDQAVRATGVFPPGMYVYNTDLIGYGYDLERARQLMSEAGYGNGIDTVYMFDVRDSDVIIKRAEYIIQCWEKIGIKCHLNPLPWQEFLEKGYRRDSILSMKSWVSDNGDPDNFLFPLFHSKSFGRAGNTSFYKNREVDIGIEQARVERSTKKRRQMYQDIEKMIVEDAPWVFLSYAVDSYVVNKNIGGFKVDPFGIVRFRYLWST